MMWVHVSSNYIVLVSILLIQQLSNAVVIFLAFLISSQSNKLTWALRCYQGLVT